MRLGNAQFLKNEQGISTHLPYVMLETDDILLTESEDRIRTWQMSGLPIDTADKYILNNALDQRMRLFAQLPHGERFRFHHTLLRVEQPAVNGVKVEVPFAQNFLNDYYSTFSRKPLYSNQHYLSLVHRPPAVARKRNFGFTNFKSEEAYQINKNYAYQQIEDASSFLEQQLSPFGAKRLKTNEDGSHELLRMLSKILNWQDLPLQSQPQNLKSYLPNVRLFIGDRAIEIRNTITGESKYATIVAIKGYLAKKTFPGLIDGLLSLPMELCLSQHFSLIPRQKSREQMELHCRQLLASEDPDSIGYIQLQDALGSIVSGDYSMGLHQLSTMIVANKLEELEDKTAAVQHVFIQANLIPVRETGLMEAVYWSQFPGNSRYLTRQISLNSGNMACMASFHNKVNGNSKSFLGNPLLLLRTPEKTSYWFNFHVGGRDVGDTLVLGEKGSGKTLLLTALASAALQYNPRIFYFDKDYGAENWINAVKGRHIVLGTGKPSGLNPLQLQDTPSNRHFLHVWLRGLLEAFGDKLTESEDHCVHQAIKHNYEDLKIEQRTLSHLQSALGTGGPGTLRNRLRPWHGEGEFAYYFDNPKDILEFTNPVNAFEMHYLLQESQLKARFPLLLYLFNRLRISLESGDLRFTLIILDEAIPLLENEYFAKEIKNWLLTLRKLNAIVVFGAQNPQSVLNSEVAPILIAETVTKIIYRPNTPIPSIYKEALHLSDGEYKSLCSIPAGSRSFLIKQPDHAIVAEMDLQSLEGYIPILSSRPQEREVFIEKIKADPENWWRSFTERVHVN